MTQTPPLIFGIGGLNIDYVVSDSSWASLPLALKGEIEAGLHPGSERGIGEAEFARLRRLLPAANVAVQAGGSSFNALRAIRALRADVRLEFIGCQGEGGAPGVLDEAFDCFAVGRAHVRSIALTEPGSCLAIQDKGERHLLTTRGANDSLTSMLDLRREEIAEALRRATIVHVTSLLDPAAPTPMLNLLHSAKALNPKMVISFDPGAHWSSAAAMDESVARLVELCDLLFVSASEYTSLRTLGLLDQTKAVAFVKSPHQVAIVDASRPDLETRIPNTLIPIQDVRDSVGAGDVFAAGVLAKLASAPNSYAEAARLGLAAARRKLLDPWPIRPTTFRDLWQ